MVVLKTSPLCRCFKSASRTSGAMRGYERRLHPVTTVLNAMSACRHIARTGSMPRGSSVVTGR